MRLQTKSPDPGSARRPSRTVAPGSPAPLRQAPASPPQPARRSDRRCGDRSVRSRRRPAPGRRSGRPERGTPLIPLTLRGMQGAPRRSARSFFVLPLVLALLALVVFPVFARAGEIPEYEVEVPTVESEVVPTHPKKQKGHQGEEPNSK